MFFSSSKTATQEDKKFICRKCGKEKKESEGMFILDGTTFCCKQCCGDPDKGEHLQKKDTVCEFC